MKGKVIKMNEYNFNIEEIEDGAGNMLPTPAPKKPKKHIGLKITASLMAMALVSAGSIGIYSQFADKPSNNVQTAENVSESDDKAVKAENMGMINNADDNSKVLDTEEIVEKVLPSVVGIESEFSIPEDYQNSFFGFGMMEQQQNPVGTGTGVVISEDGYIVTNAHVIYDSEHGYGLASKISVLLSDDSTNEAEVIGYDVDCDLAVLKIEAEGLTAAEFGNSDELRLGESVTAIGNPLGFDLMNTVTKGIVSGLNRSITINDKSMNLIQTDAAINSGNSGGPLINKYGQVIGINSSKLSSTYGSASIEGIGFAIPSNETAAIVKDLMEFGYVTGKPQLGISCQNVTETVSQMYNMPIGVYIVEVTPDGAADKANLKSGDILIKADGETITNTEELNAKKNLHKAGEEMELTFVRNGEEHTATITLDEITKNS